MEQNFLAPGPKQSEFDTLNTQVQGLADQIANKIKYKTLLNNTTDANGNVSLELDNNYLVISVWGDYMAIPFVYNGNWYAKMVGSSATYDVKASNSISYLRIAYIGN